MTKLIHLSDLHFGTERPGYVDRVVEDIKQLNPDLIVISGDLTQRALRLQYQSARSFINKLRKYPTLCVPGNHDISLHNPIERFFFPFAKYQKFITASLNPTYNHHNISVMGINSATPFKPMGGYVTEQQLNDMVTYFATAAKNQVRILVMHHNLIRSERHKIINNSEKIITYLAKAKVNLVLSGHLHVARIEQIKRNYLSQNMYVMTAGTAISTRTKEPNSYNVIEIVGTEFKFSLREFINHNLTTTHEKTFQL